MKKTVSKLLTITVLSGFVFGCNAEKIYDGVIHSNNFNPISSNSNVNVDESEEYIVYNKPNKLYARISAKHASICPKLLQKNLDNSDIYRSKEYLNGNYCDYYIYPKIGQVLSVESDNSKLDAFLIMPQNYDFANGPYVIDKNRRHIIRVIYDGIESKPDEFSYSINFDLKD